MNWLGIFPAYASRRWYLLKRVLFWFLEGAALFRAPGPINPTLNIAPMKSRDEKTPETNSCASNSLSMRHPLWRYQIHTPDYPGWPDNDAIPIRYNSLLLQWLIQVGSLFRWWSMIIFTRVSDVHTIFNNSCSFFFYFHFVSFYH